MRRLYYAIKRWFVGPGAPDWRTWLGHGANVALIYVTFGALVLGNPVYGYLLGVGRYWGREADQFYATWERWGPPWGQVARAARAAGEQSAYDLKDQFMDLFSPIWLGALAVALWLLFAPNVTLGSLLG
jgi:hypothetical protein